MMRILVVEDEKLLCNGIAEDLAVSYTHLTLPTNSLV